jgi:hypothetical protein
VVVRLLLFQQYLHVHVVAHLARSWIGWRGAELGPVRPAGLPVHRQPRHSLYRFNWRAGWVSLLARSRPHRLSASGLRLGPPVWAGRPLAVALGAAIPAKRQSDPVPADAAPALDRADARG